MNDLPLSRPAEMSWALDVGRWALGVVPKPLLLLALLSFSPSPSRADTTIDSAATHAYGANIGWINLRGDTTNGAVVGEFICTGSIYSANVGWISLGNGAPANGVRYQNNSATDWGVNTQDYVSTGTSVHARLRGSAYSANAGWIQFETTGDPRVDLITGRLHGYAYGANIGWIALSEAGVTVKTTAIAQGPDTDTDTIPDAWERLHTGALTLLALNHDQDGDGVLDADEYGADSNPLDPADAPRILTLIPPRQFEPGGPFVTDVTFTTRPTRRYALELSADLKLPWTLHLDSLLPAAGATTSLSFADTPTSNRFYRIRAKLPLAP
jgi:hypothetical protein